LKFSYRVAGEAYYVRV